VDFVVVDLLDDFVLLVDDLWLDLLAGAFFEPLPVAFLVECLPFPWAPLDAAPRGGTGSFQLNASICCPT
jgi:hypothetical protein